MSEKKPRPLKKLDGVREAAKINTGLVKLLKRYPITTKTYVSWLEIANSMAMTAHLLGREALGASAEKLETCQ